MLKSWFVANFESATTALLALILIPLHIIKGGGKGLLILALFIVAPFTFSIARFWEIVLGYVAFVAFGIYCICDGMGYYYIAGIIVTMAVGMVVGFLCACYAKLNFYDTVSRQMLYRSSKVQLFQKEWEYAINRFCVISCCVMWILFAIFLFAEYKF
jgi:hypothetical protein